MLALVLDKANLILIHHGNGRAFAQERPSSIGAFRAHGYLRQENSSDL